MFVSFLSDWVTTTNRLLDPNICLPHKDGGTSLITPPKGTTSNLAGPFSHFPFRAKRQERNLLIRFLKSSVRLDMALEPTSCEADAPITTLSLGSVAIIMRQAQDILNMSALVEQHLFKFAAALRGY